MQYSIALLILYKYMYYFLLMDEGNNNTADLSFSLVRTLLTKKNVHEVPLLIGYLLIESLNEISRETDLIEESNTPEILNSLNSLMLDSSPPSLKLLDCIYSIFRTNDL